MVQIPDETAIRLVRPWRDAAIWERLHLTGPLWAFSLSGTLSQEEAGKSLAESERLLAAAHLELNLEKSRIVDFAHGFRFLGALFQGDGIWVPWKNDRVKGRLLFMARPLPPALRTRFEMEPPRRAVEEALRKAGATTAGGRWAQTAATAEGPLAGRHCASGAEGVKVAGENGRSLVVAYLYLTEQGAVLRKAGDRFLVEKDDEVLLDLPYHKLETVLLFGNIQVTTQAMAELLEKGVHLSLFSRQGQYRGSLSPPRGRNIELRLAQFDCYRDAARSLGLARAVVRAKTANGLAVLRRYRARNEVAAEFDARVKALEETVAGCEGAATVAALDGSEGASAHAYFTLLMEFNKSDLAWPGRQKHPAPDPLNALLSLAYTLLMHELAALLEGAGLDPYLGFLHQVDYGRPSLVQCPGNRWTCQVESTPP